MKKLLVALLAIVLLVAMVMPTLADDFKFSGWAHNDNTIGKTFASAAAGKDQTGSYELQSRFGVFKQINDSLSYTFQMRVLADERGGADGNYNAPSLYKDGVQNRLNFFNYKLNDTSSLTIGGTAYWLLNGVLMDDFVDGVALNTKLGDATSLQVLAGYTSAYHSQVYDVEANTAISGISLAFNYMAAEDSAWAGSTGGSSTVWVLDNTGTAVQQTVPAGTWTSAKGIYGTNWKGISIMGVNVGYNVMPTLNLQLAYAINTAADKTWYDNSGSDNTVTKFQVYFSGVEKTDIIVQYWKQGGFLFTPSETGNHMTWWGDMYHNGATGGLQSPAYNGMTGERLIVDHAMNDNVRVCFYYGTYKQDVKVSAQDATKMGLETYVSF